MARTILIIDDSEVVLEIAKTTLEAAGYVVSTNRRATGSVGLILQTKPDLVLLDVNMPTLRGDMVARMSMATNKTTGTLVVLHSSLPEEELSRLKVESGAHGYIRKTENTHHFLRQNRRFLEDSAPKSLDPSSTRESERLPTSGTVRKGTSILLVDSDMSALSALRRQVQALGYSPSFALSIGQLSAKLENETPDVIFLSHAFRHWKELFALLTPSFLQQRLVLFCDDHRNVPIGFTGKVLIRPSTEGSLKELISQVLRDDMGLSDLK